MSFQKRNGFKPKSGKLPSDPEEDRRFEELRRKYSNVVGFLLVKNIKQSELRPYFEMSEDNQRRYASVKKFRADIIEARPRAKQWVDKAFYLGLKLGDSVQTATGATSTQIILGDCIFKQCTEVVSSKAELDNYIETIAKIIDSEKIWNDPDMADFDTGEREDTGTRLVKKAKVIDIEENTEASVLATGVEEGHAAWNYNPSGISQGVADQVRTRSRAMIPEQ